MTPTDAQLRAFVHALPRTETHLHLEGAIPYDLLHDWQPDRYPPSPGFHQPGFRFHSFRHFDETLLGHALPWFTSADRYHEAAKAIFARHLADNVRYVETSFHLPVTGFVGIPASEIVAAIRSAVPGGLEVRVFAGMLRNDYTGPMRETIDRIAEMPDVAGVDLHGFERTPTEPWCATVWRRMNEAGKVTKCHAGEFDGPHRVREAIEELGVRRVQHGVRAVEDPDVVELAAARGVTFDLCPISNVRLGVVPSLAAHPIRELMASGINCTISTDDPLLFDNRVSDEYIGLAIEAGFDHAGLAQLARNGWKVADVPESTRSAMIAEIDRILESSRAAVARAPVSKGPHLD
jgi:adenosine deaminase